ncbi:type I restriction endonuclease [Camelimonas sp. ID_303_24]
MSTFTEDTVEQAAIHILQDLGWAYRHGSEIAPDSATPERRSFSDVILLPRLEAAIK